MENLSAWLTYTLLDNQVRDLLRFAGILGLGFLIRRGLSFTISRAIYRFIKKEVGTIPLAEFVRLTRRPFEVLITLTTIFLAFRQLTVPSDWEWASAEQFGWLMVIEKTFFTFLAGAIGWLGIRVIKFIALIFKQQAAETPTPLDDQLVPFVKESIKVVIAVFSLFFIQQYIFFSGPKKFIFLFRNFN